MRTIYVLDTSVLITDPQAFRTFKESDVCLHITILDELDKLKKQQGLTGKNARVATRLLDEVCKSALNINDGVLLDDDILFSIDATEYQGVGDSLYGDTRILAYALAPVSYTHLTLPTTT